MTTEKLYGFRQELSAQSTLFCYSGPVSQGLIEEIGAVIKRRMQLQETRTSMIQRLFGIFVEQVQNIMNYSADFAPAENGVAQLKSGIVVIGREAHGYCLLCGNLIENREKETLSAILHDIEAKDKEELNVLYRQKLREGQPEVGRGAGLGLIEVMRKASAPIEYRFEEVDARHSFFSSKVTIQEDEGCDR